MTEKRYWLDLFTGTTWNEFKKAGGKISGFRKSRWNTVKKIKTGDLLICYLTGVSRFIGVLEVTSKPYQDSSIIWKDEDFPCRLSVEILAELTPETAVPIHTLRDKLSFFQNLISPHAWTGHFRGSPAQWKSADGLNVLEAIQAAVKNPVVREVDPRKLARRPRAITTSVGPVTIPESDSDVSTFEPKAATEHTEIQALLLKLGADMGFDVWVARNDRGRDIGKKKLSEFSRLRKELPRQFDEATNKTIELIDVLWLDGNAIIAAFEIESTTSIYSGLLRMSDLIAMQPNLKIPLYLVAPDEKREKVITEVNRPTFSRNSPSLADICRFIPFTVLKHQLKKVEPIIQYLKPEFLEELSESCEAEDLG